MYKAIALLKAKAGLTREQFKDYYENHHVPLILRHMPQMVDYRRNYIQSDGGYLGADIEAVAFDVVTEFCFRNKADYEAANQVFNDPAVLAEIEQDEEQFLDRGKTVIFVVDERVSAIPED